jgi:hypothetical protein
VTTEDGYFPRSTSILSLTHGSCVPELEMVAATERRRIEKGQPTPQLAG